jgi:hypothetical protein
VRFAETIFRRPIAPLKTNNTKATTVDSFDIDPPSGETNPEAVYAVPFLNGTEKCCV